ncbi:uncharacterized protein LOC135500574 isoform X2 [Lineus longissimus]|uniref:uncharacterized protein LOC135500574 isoform X2 n=1 Tax=Lineus longissimus TaxID=88925 RepID=UPI002B4F8EE9
MNLIQKAAKVKMSADNRHTDASSLSTFVEGFHDLDAVKKTEYKNLGRTGLCISSLSYGASALGSVFRDTDDEESLKVVEAALKYGVNYIDTAPWYGHGKSEQVLGKALKNIPRNAYYIATKVGRYKPNIEEMFDFSAERVLRSVDESLANLGLPYVDIIQVHDMEFAPSLDIIINETLPALQKIKESGKARFIGITGYPLQNFRVVLERSKVPIDTILTYCRGSINDVSLQDYIPYFKSKDVGIINASPISMGLLTSRGPPSWHPATPEIKEAAARAAKHCQEVGVDISSLALKYCVSNPDVHTTLFSSASLKNVESNIKTSWNPMTDLEKSTLDEIMERFFNPLTTKHWEGRELETYRNALRAHKDGGQVSTVTLG